MSTIIICAVLALICIYAVISYTKRLKNGCCGSGGGEIKIKPADADISHYPFEYIVDIGGMTCSHCKMRVENAFNATGEFIAKVNLKSKCADVRSKNEADERRIAQIVERAGYEFEGIEKRQRG